MILEFSWWLLLPIMLSALYGCTEALSKAALKLPVLRVWASWLLTSLATAFLTVSWSAVGYPLPILYLLVYLCQAVRLIAGQNFQIKNQFILNLNYTNILTLHLVTIGVAALAQAATMRSLLVSPFWRIISVSVVLLVIIAEDLCFLRWRNFSALLASAADSEEAKPFMAFLWFCAGYLLIDSVLCMFELEPLYPPLFLSGSSAVVMFTLIRFLLHINNLVKNNHLKEEHDRLASKLEATEVSADSLRQLAERDVLTGVFSRRYAMSRMEALIAAKIPFSLAYLDLDALKQINDTQGHDAGDRYLVQFSNATRSRLQDGDLLARVGGDEFIVLMPNCDADTAAKRIQKIRSDLEQARQGETALRFSYGVTAISEGPIDVELLICEADRAMYQDKMRRHRAEGRV